MEIKRRFSGDSTVYTTINQNLEFYGGEEKIRKIGNRSCGSIIGSDRDSTSDFNDRESRRFVEITVGAIR